MIEEPPLAISTPLDEYYVGETIPWSVRAPSVNGEIRVALLADNRTMAEHTGRAENGQWRGTFETRALNAGIYTLQASLAPSSQGPHLARRQVIVAPDPFVWR